MTSTTVSQLHASDSLNGDSIKEKNESTQMLIVNHCFFAGDRIKTSYIR